MPSANDRAAQPIRQHAEPIVSNGAVAELLWAMGAWLNGLRVTVVVLNLGPSQSLAELPVVSLARWSSPNRLSAKR